jgi:hypothetical protein
MDLHPAGSTGKKPEGGVGETLAIRFTPSAPSEGYFSMIVRSATRSDTKGISDLLQANSARAGGPLTGDWSVGVVESLMNEGNSILLAMEGPNLLGVLFASEKAQASAPPVVAMLEAWPGKPGAYVYGPVCISEAVRGRGVLEALYRELSRRYAGREGILFIKQANARSLKAHARLGMKPVSRFQLDGEEFIVLSTEGASS